MTKLFLLFSILQHLGQDSHVFDAPSLVKPGPQDDGIEPEVVSLYGPALHGPVGLLVQPDSRVNMDITSLLSLTCRPSGSG